MQEEEGQGHSMLIEESLISKMITADSFEEKVKADVHCVVLKLLEMVNYALLNFVSPSYCYFDGDTLNLCHNSMKKEFKDSVCYSSPESPTEKVPSSSL